MPDVQSEDKRSVLVWVKRIGDLRDGLLVGASLLYGLGYVVWSLNAWVNNLGILPLIESQYFMAGIGPALILWLACNGVRPMRWLMHQLPSWIGPDVKGWRRAGRALMLACFWGSLAGFFLGPSDWFRSMFPTWIPLGPGAVLLTCAGVFVVAAALYSGSDRQTDWVHALYAKIYTYGIPFGIASAALSFWFVAHRALPHELGGSRPRCAYLDVSRAKMSDDSLRDLVPSDTISANRPVMRSNRLWVHFSGRDFMLVRPIIADRQGVLRAAPGVYEITRGAVEAVNWCGRRDG